MTGKFDSLRPRRLLALVLGLAAVAVAVWVGGRILGPSVPAYVGIASATLATILLAEGLLRLRGGWRKLLVSIGIVGPLVLLTASIRIGLAPAPTFGPLRGSVAETVLLAVCAASLFFAATDAVMFRPRVRESVVWAVAAVIGLSSWAGTAGLRHENYLAEQRAFRQARADFGAGRYDSALEECGTALVTAPDPDSDPLTERERALTRAVWNGKGLALRRLGRADEAVAAYGEALRFGKDPEVLNNRAVAELSLGETDRAATDLDEAIRLDPGDSLLRLDRGLVWKKAGDPDRARAAFEKALALRPGWDRASRELARLGN